MRLRQIIFIWLFAVLMINVGAEGRANASNVSCTKHGPGGGCIHYGNKIGYRPVNVNKAGLWVKQPKGRGPLPAQAIYRVALHCVQVGNLPVEPQEGILTQSETVTSHTIAFTKKRISGTGAITSKLPIVHVYTLAGKKANRSSFIDPNCNTSFYFSGRDKIYLAVSLLKGTTHTPNQFLSTMYAAASTAFPLWTLFVSSDLEKIVKSKLDRIEKTQDPLKNALQTLDSKGSVSYPYDIRLGTYVIKTDYSKVIIKVTKVDSLLKAGPAIVADYESTFNALGKTLFGNNPGDKAIKKNCGKFRDDALFRGFSPDDVTYALTYAAILQDESSEQSFACLGRDGALRARKFSIWKTYPTKKWSKGDIANYFGEEGGLINVAQPSRLGSYKRFFNQMMWALGTYAQKDAKGLQPSSHDIRRFLASRVRVENSSAAFNFLTASLSPKAMMAALVKKRTVRFGCVTGDNAGGAAMFLALPSAPKNKDHKYTLNETTVFHAWLNGHGRVGALEVDFDKASAAIAEKANDKACGQTVVFQ